MTKKYYEHDVDKWIIDNNEYYAYKLFNELLPKHSKKLDNLDKKIMSLLSEIREVFPDAQYYTASGGFNLILGRTHEGDGEQSQQQRAAWSGSAKISDGDW